MQNELFMIDSPCIGVCAMNKKGYCVGCFRKRSERQAWHTLGDHDKAKILKTLAKRRQNLKAILRQKQGGQTQKYQLSLYDELDSLEPPKQLGFDFE